MAKNAIKLTGLKQVTGNLRRMKVRLVDEANKVMKSEAQVALQRAKGLTPVRTGALRASGRTQTTKTATGETVEIRFGDGLDYGLIVHETHKTGKKFLTNAVRETGRGLTERLAQKLASVLRKVIK